MSRLIRLPELKKITGYSRSTIYRQEIAGRFPKRVTLTRNIVAWDEDEILTWLKSQLAGRLVKTAS